MQQPIPPADITETRARLTSALASALAPLGPFLEDARVVEIMLNADGVVWIDRIGEGMVRTGVRMERVPAEAMLRLVAADVGVQLTASSPALAAKLPPPWAARLQAFLPPVVDAPVFALRKPPRIVFSLPDYLRAGILTGRLTRCFAVSGAAEGGLDLLLELADSQITYRQRYVMVAAPAPVIDLVFLDPNNPRSMAFALDSIEAHLAALPGRSAAGRLSPVQQIAAALATRLRTVDVAEVDEAMILEAEQALMKLSDAISPAYLTNTERAEASRETLA